MAQNDYDLMEFSSGNATNELSGPYDIKYDLSSNTIYAADTGNQRFMICQDGISSGTLVAGGKEAGNNNNQLNFPYSLYFDSSSNSLLIVNSNNVISWMIGATNWTLVADNINGVSGTSSIALAGPRDLTLDPMGNIYVADSSNHRIQLFLNDQSNGTTIAGVRSTMGNSSPLLMSSASVALDSQLNLYVVDRGNERVLKFLRY